MIKKAQNATVISTAIGIPLALLIAIEPANTAIGFFGILVTATVVSMIYYNLRGLLFFFGTFVLVQDLIAENMGGYESTFGGVIKKTDEFFILAVVLVMALVTVVKRTSFVRSTLDFPLLGILTVGILSSVAASVPLYIAGSQLFLLMKGFLVFYIFANLHLAEEEAAGFIKFFGIVAVILLCIGFLNLAIPELFRELMGSVAFVDLRAGIPSIVSTFIHPGVFGWFMAFCGLFAFSFSFVYQERIHFIMAFSFMIGVFLSMRRRCFLGVLIGLMIGIRFLPYSRKTRYGILFVLIAIGFFIIAWPKVEFLYKDMISLYFKRPAHQEMPRVTLYKKSTQIAKDYFPFGAGMGRYASWMSRVHYSPVYDQYDFPRGKDLFINDTFWPMILGETGFIGLFFYFWLMLKTIFIPYGGIHNADTRFKKAFCLGSLMVLSEALVESLTTPIFVKPPQVYFVFGVIGMTYSMMSQSLKSEK